MKNISLIKEKILESEQVAVAGHINPDGDCIGSLLSLGLGLASIGKSLALVLQDGVPFNYKKLPGAGKIRKRIDKVPDMAIVVDCGSKEMVGRPFKLMEKAKYILEIDHHEHREPFGNLSLVDTKAAAVGEIVYYLLKSLKVKITAGIAQSILTSIIVETNSFRLPVLRPNTFSVCAALLKTGVDFSRLSQLVYWSKTREMVVLSGLCMSKLKLIKNGQIAWSIVSGKDFSLAGAKPEDLDSAPNDILSINTVKIAILFREEKRGQLRVSLRSKNRLNVASLARKRGGGGHFDSAGCYIPNKKSKIEKLLKEAQNLLK